MLALLNWRVDPALVQPYAPRGTELDFHAGETFVSVVGFLFQDTRVLGVPIPFHRTFEEVNLRFYIRRGDRRGVSFIREIVPRQAIATVAKLAYNEPYVALPMRHRVGQAEAAYGWKHRYAERVSPRRWGPDRSKSSLPSITGAIARNATAARSSIAWSIRPGASGKPRMRD